MFHSQRKRHGRKGYNPPKEDASTPGKRKTWKSERSAYEVEKKTRKMRLSHPEEGKTEEGWGVVERGTRKGVGGAKEGGRGMNN